MDVTGRIHGRDMSHAAPALAAVGALPGYEAEAEDVLDGWSVRYIVRGVSTAEESWAIPACAIAAVDAVCA